MVTMKTMCEYIAEKMKSKNPNCDITAKEIFNYSPTGELSHIFILYNDLKMQENE